jgi:hypothetical protein
MHSRILASLRCSTHLIRQALRPLYLETSDKGDAACQTDSCADRTGRCSSPQARPSVTLRSSRNCLKSLNRIARCSKACSAACRPSSFGNAVRWLGLRKGEGTRERLAQFYQPHEVPDPDWMAKVAFDQLRTRKGVSDIQA